MFGVSSNVVKQVVVPRCLRTNQPAPTPLVRILWGWGSSMDLDSQVQQQHALDLPEVDLQSYQVPTAQVDHGACGADCDRRTRRCTFTCARPQGHLSRPHQCQGCAPPPRRRQIGPLFGLTGSRRASTPRFGNKRKARRSVRGKGSADVKKSFKYHHHYRG